MKRDWSAYVAIGLFFVIFTKSSACSNGKVLNLSDLPMRLPSASSDYWSGGSDSVLSDDNLASQWYRAVYNGRQYLMVDSNDKPDHQDCSTYYPVYLQGIHPLAESLTETGRSFVACKRDYFYPCSVKYAIKIRRCGTDVQYYLPPTEHYNAFCFQDAETASPSTEVISTTLQISSIILPNYTTYPSATRITSGFSSQASQVTKEPPTSVDSGASTSTAFSEHTLQTNQSTSTHSFTTGYGTTTPTPVTTQGKTVSVTWEPSTQVHHATYSEYDSTTTGRNLNTTLEQSGLSKEETVDDVTNKIIIILIVCMGIMIIIIMGLVAVIMRYKRKENSEEVGKSTIAEETEFGNDHNHEMFQNIYETMSERGSVIKPYESLKGDKIFTMNQPDYDRLTPFEIYQTLDRSIINTRDEHFYQTLP